MHELAVTQNILDIATRYAKEAQATRVTDLYLVIGQLSSVVDESVQFYWDIISEGTLCEGAKLHFERIPTVLKCQECGHAFGLEGELTPCPRCESINVRVTSGEEFRLDSIGVEQADNADA